MSFKWWSTCLACITWSIVTFDEYCNNLVITYILMSCSLSTISQLYFSSAGSKWFSSLCWQKFHKELIYKLLIQMWLEAFFHIIIAIFRLILKNMNCLPIKKESYLRSAILNCLFKNHFTIDLCRMTICGTQDIINDNESYIWNIFI